MKRLNSNNDFKEEYGELLLRRAAIISAEEDKEIYNKFSNDDFIVNSNQKKLDSKILNMIKSYENDMKRKSTFMKLKKLASKAAIFIAIFTIGFYITFSTVDAFKITVINFFIEQKEKFSLLSLTENNPSPVPSELTEKYYPHYLPEGYELSDTFVNDNSVEISYINKENEIINYGYFGIDATTGIDTENRTETSVLINGNQGYIYSKNNHKILTFTSYDCIFVIDGFITQEEMIKMAESIK